MHAVSIPLAFGIFGWQTERGWVEWVLWAERPVEGWPWGLGICLTLSLSFSPSSFSLHPSPLLPSLTTPLLAGRLGRLGRHSLAWPDLAALSSFHHNMPSFALLLLTSCTHTFSLPLPSMPLSFPLTQRPCLSVCAAFACFLPPPLTSHCLPFLPLCLYITFFASCYLYLQPACLTFFLPAYLFLLPLPAFVVVGWLVRFVVGVE